MHRPRATSDTDPQAKQGSRGIEHENVFGKTRTNRRLKAATAVSILSIVLWLAGCGNSASEAGSVDEQYGPNTDTADSAANNPGIREIPEIDEGKLQTPEGREKVFKEQSITIAKNVTGTLTTADSETVATWHETEPPSESDEYGFWTVLSAEGKDMVVAVDYSIADPIPDSDRQSAILDHPQGKKRLHFYLNESGESPSDDSALSAVLTVPDSVIDQSRTPQELLSNLETEDNAIEAKELASFTNDQDTGDPTVDYIEQTDDRLIMTRQSFGLDWAEPDPEAINQAEPFGEAMESARQNQAALLDRLS